MITNSRIPSGKDLHETSVLHSAPVAQRKEQRFPKPCAGSSNLSEGTMCRNVVTSTRCDTVNTKNYNTARGQKPCYVEEH